MKKHGKGLLYCALAAAALEAGWLFVAHQPSNGPNLFTLCIVPFFMFASLFSGSLGDVVFYVSIFLAFFAYTSFAYWVWRRMTRKNHDP